MDFNVLGIGMPEMVGIAAIALLVLGPQRLARHAFTLGRLVRQARIWVAEMTQVLQQEIAPLASGEIFSDIQEDLQSIRSDLSEGFMPKRAGAREDSAVEGDSELASPPIPASSREASPVIHPSEMPLPPSKPESP